MATQHVLTCPNCHASLLLEHSDSVGGVVKPNVLLLDYAEETPVAAKARGTLDTATAALVDAEAALTKAQTTLAEANAKIPPDADQVKSATDARDQAQQVRDQAQAEVDDAAEQYERARNLPPPPPIGTLSPDGHWKWMGTEWQEVAATPPPLPAAVAAMHEGVATADVTGPLATPAETV